MPMPIVKCVCFQANGQVEPGEFPNYQCIDRKLTFQKHKLNISILARGNEDYDHDSTSKSEIQIIV